MEFHQRSYKPMDYKSMANLGTDLGTFQAQQLQGLNQMISVGAGSPEVITLRRDMWESIPKQHFEEMRRLSKLTGVEPSIHAPMVDTVGLSQGFYSEESRKAEERIIEDVVDKAHSMAPDRNVIVNVHSEALGKGTIWRKNLPELVKEEARDDLVETFFGRGRRYRDLSPAQKEELDREMQKELTYGIDRESGQLVPLKFEIKYYPPETPEERKRGYKQVIWTPEKTLRSANQTQWMGEVEGLHQHEFRLREVDDRLRKGENATGLKGYQETLMSHADNEVINLFHKLQRHSPFERENWDKLRLEEQAALAEQKKKYDELKEKQLEEHERTQQAKKELEARYKETKSEIVAANAMHLINSAERKNISDWADFFSSTVRQIKAAPQRIVPLEDFTIDQASKTFAEAAEHSLFEVAKGNVNHAPIISIENPPAQQFGISRGAEMAKLVERSREEAERIFMKKHNMSESAAKAAAEKLIGATWDVGHINQLRQGGYSEKDMLKDTEKIAPFVKHMHITDNFGSADSHLPPGMGNVPVKEMQAIISKSGFKGKSILETGGFISNFKTSPWPYILDSMDSPIYEFDAAPTWGPSMYKYETGYSGFTPGYGNILPSQHFSIYGAGFLLPPTFGAATPGESKRSEFTGTPIS